jgi:inorganic triphosphatase YgiF
MSANNHQEVELKLSCRPATARSLVSLLTELTHGAPRTVRLQNTYYDTQEQALRQHGSALRIRRQGKLLLQTVKCNGSVKGGLSSRPEWESPYRGQFDFSEVTDTAVRSQLEALSKQPGLQATLSTDFKRDQWEYWPAEDTHIQIMLDRGKIVAGSRQMPICELELELVSGDARYLFALAQRLCKEAALFPAPLSKAARGSLLLDGETQAQNKKPAPPTSDQALGEAFASLMQACLDHVSHHLPTNCLSFGQEELHQVRVGLRRMLALLVTFKPWLRKSWHQASKNGVHRHLDALAEARNCHVLLNEVCAVVPDRNQAATGKRLHIQLKALTEKTFAQAQAHLNSPAFAAWLLDCSLDLHVNEPIRKGERKTRWSHVASELLHKKISDYAKAVHHARNDARSMHQLRIQTKYLRYQHAVLSNKRRKPFMQQLAALQDGLGRLNDLNVAGDILRPLAESDKRLEGAVRAIGAWHLARQTPRLHTLSQQRQQLMHTLGKLKRKTK